jgi:adenine C2-methylase RlmN of 23S rRNA A2503 and tRNA A37
LATASARSKPDQRLADIRFLPVIPNPHKILCAGVNYKSHAAEVGRELPKQPSMFIRFTDTLKEALPINLAISLHSPDDVLRSEMMPINRRYPIAALLDATRDYIAQTHRRVSFEYVLLQGKNDRPEQAIALAELLQGMLCHINLIPWNPVPGAPLGRSDRARVLHFQHELVDRGIACTVRVERGMSIAAACGQLAGVPVGEPIPLVSA